MLKEYPSKTEEQKRLHPEYWRLNDIKKDCIDKMSAIRKDLCNTFPFKVGDYVIFGGWTKRQGWITRMSMDEFLHNIHIYFNPPKKDGTPSRREECYSVNIYSDLDQVEIKRK